MLVYMVTEYSSKEVMKGVAHKANSKWIGKGHQSQKIGKKKGWDYDDKYDDHLR